MSEPEISDFAPSHDHTDPDSGSMWEARAEYQASDGRWIRLSVIGIDHAYFGSTASKAIKNLMDAWAKVLTPEFITDEAGTRLTGKSRLRRREIQKRLTSTTHLRITLRRVPMFRPTEAHSKDFQHMMKSALRAIDEDGPELPTYEELSKDTDSIEVRDGTGRLVASIDADRFRGRPPTLRGSLLADDEALKELIESAPDIYDRDGYIEDPMLHDVPIELLPEGTPTDFETRKLMKHLSGTREAELDDDEAPCRWCGRSVDVCPFPDDAVAHGL